MIPWIATLAQTQDQTSAAQKLASNKVPRPGNKAFHDIIRMTPASSLDLPESLSSPDWLFIYRKERPLEGRKKSPWLYGQINITYLLQNCLGNVGMLRPVELQRSVYKRHRETLEFPFFHQNRACSMGLWHV